MRLTVPPTAGHHPFPHHTKIQPHRKLGVMPPHPQHPPPIVPEPNTHIVSTRPDHRRRPRREDHLAHSVRMALIRSTALSTQRRQLSIRHPHVPNLYRRIHRPGRQNAIVVFAPIRRQHFMPMRTETQRRRRLPHVPNLHRTIPTGAQKHIRLPWVPLHRVHTIAVTRKRSQRPRCPQRPHLHRIVPGCRQKPIFTYRIPRQRVHFVRVLFE